MFSGLEHIIRENEPLARYTWFRFGGPAQYFAEPTSVDELAALTQQCRRHKLPVRVLGGGSNVLVHSEGIAGMVIHLSAPAFCGIDFEGQMLSAGGGAKLSHAISTAVREGLGGLESLVGIPGTVGGALHGNAGQHGADIGTYVHEATVMTRGGEVLTRHRDEMHFAYRHSSLDELAILNARFQLEPEDVEQLTRRMQKLWIVTRARQPSDESGSGRIFKNPVHTTAAEVIEQVGFKGTRVGSAEVSDRDANHIVTGPGTTSDDVLQLIELIRSRVAQRLEIQLENEIEIW